MGIKNTTTGIMGITTQEARLRSEARKMSRQNRLDSILQTYANRIPERHKDLFIKAAIKEASPREAIKAKCHECVNYEDTKTRIAGCTTKRCPLWAYRPYFTGGINETTDPSQINL